MNKDGDTVIETSVEEGDAIFKEGLNDAKE